MGVFSRFGGDRPEDLMRQAKAAYEKVLSLDTDSHRARSVRLRMSMLCRAHLDKTFIDGAERMANWQEMAAHAFASGTERPELPEASTFQKVRSGEGDVYVYLPEQYVDLAFSLGGRYQRTEIDAQQAIDAMQGLADHISFYDLCLEEPFTALQFLRDELAEEAGGESYGSGGD